MRWLGALSVTELAMLVPCLVFLFSDGVHVFGGNNEDYIDPDTRMWVVPAEGGQHGRICFGFADGFAQGGVNDAGLFFDGLALDHAALPESDRPAFAGNFGDFALAECSTVAEVVELFARYDPGFLADAQLLFGDRTGDGAILEGGAVIQKQGSYLLATNFRHSETSPRAATCERFQSADRLLGEARGASLDLCRRVLSATHQESPAATLYSNVYDLEQGLIHLYHFHEYESAVVIDVAVELAKGAHELELSSLFPLTHAFASFQRQTEDHLAAERERARDKSVDPRTFDDFTGRFRVREGDAAGLELDVLRAGDRLFVEFEGQERDELIPRGGSKFVCISLSARAELTFVRGGDGAFREVTLRQGDFEARAFELD